MKKLLVAVILLVVVLVTGWFLYKHFVTNRIMDWGGMENPDAYKWNVEDKN